ncbi:RibD family protein [Roseococcus pinisoli]|uniref:RibD family protein n=1 Tax=Roseococcus pinisoli TaxID=2835040 RepID=A0ABS5QBM6_9PROT|nr:RibD family protein [Roseococcus pinisoli]MBS7811094.1 RibD family protein [Roseococcus pinisoli]
MHGAQDTEWQALLTGCREGAGALATLFSPFLTPPATPDGCLVIGRLAQTLDGRIATHLGHSQWIGGPGDLRHTHRLRALCDAVVVGAGTVRADDPRLTTRLVEGPSPVRVVIDPRRRLGVDYSLFREGPPTLLVTACDGPATHGTADTLRIGHDAAGELDLASLLRALAARGLRKIFVEGGGQTVSRFLVAGCLDRLHVTVAPMILGSGRPAFDLPEVARISEGMRFSWTCHPIEPDMLFDIAIDRRAA